MEGKIAEGKPGSGHKVYDGVEVDGNGRVVAYHISNTYPHQITSEPQKWQRVEAYGAKTGLPNILHIMDSERPDQYRGCLLYTSLAAAEKIDSARAFLKGVQA